MGLFLTNKHVRVKQINSRVSRGGFQMSDNHLLSKKPFFDIDHQVDKKPQFLALPEKQYDRGSSETPCFVVWARMGTGEKNVIRG